MSAYRYWTLTCDWCGEIHDPGTAKTAIEARESAAAEGWHKMGHKDACPRHYGYISTPSGWIYLPEVAAKNAEQFPLKRVP
jgi:hypothetical protein